MPGTDIRRGLAAQTHRPFSRAWAFLPTASARKLVNCAVLIVQHYCYTLTPRACGPIAAAPALWLAAGLPWAQ